MSWRIVRFEPTPNPNALKCWLDSPISDRPRSYRTAGEAAGDDLALRLFAEAGITTLLFNGQWMTINKPAEAKWDAVKRRVQKVLDEAVPP